MICKFMLGSFTTFTLSIQTLPQNFLFIRTVSLPSLLICDLSSNIPLAPCMAGYYMQIIPYDRGMYIYPSSPYFSYLLKGALNCLRDCTTTKNY